MLKAVISAAVVVALPVSMTTVARVHASEPTDATDSEKSAKVNSKEENVEKKEAAQFKDPIHKQLSELREKQRDKRIYISQLPLYGEPDTGELVYVAETEESLRKHVAVMRKAVWRELDRFEGAWSVVKDKCRSAKQNTQDLARYLREDAGALPRATFITVSGLGGIIVGYKGGVIRKVIYASVGMTGAAAVCYPEQAVDISRRGWILTKEQAKDIWQQAKSSTGNARADVEKKKEATSSTPDGNKETPKSSTKDTVTVAEKDTDEQTVPPKKDFGMSKKEDKDMYSTRTS